MDCVEACPPHHRRLSPLVHRLSTSVAGVSDVITGVVGSGGSNCGRCVCVTVSDTPPKDFNDSPFHASQEPHQRRRRQQPITTTTTTSNPITTAAHAPAFAQDNQHQGRHPDTSTATTVHKAPQQNREVERVPLSGCSGSVTTAATDSPQHSAPLFEVPASFHHHHHYHHYQQAQGARTHRPVEETSLIHPHSCSSLGPSQDSRLGSQARTHGDDEKDSNDDTLSVACLDSATAAAVCGSGDDKDDSQHQHQQHHHHPHHRHSSDLLQQHRVKCGVPFTKRQRPQPQDRSQALPEPPPHSQPANLRDAEEKSHLSNSSGAAMYIPDLFRFADSSSHRRRLATTKTASAEKIESVPRSSGQVVSDSCSPTHTHHHHSSGGNKSKNNVRVLDDVVFEEDQEVQRARHPPPHLWCQGARKHRNESPSLATAGVIVVAGGGATVTDVIPSRLSAPDATPQEPQPKRFATGEGEAVVLDELRYASSSTTAGTLSQIRDASINEDGEDVNATLTSPSRSASGVEKIKEDVLPSVDWAVKQQQQQQQRYTGVWETGAGGDVSSHNCSSGSVSRNAPSNGRHLSDSVIAGIPYDPSRFPPPSQPQKSTFAPVTAAAAAVVVVAATDPAFERVSDSLEIKGAGEPFCATPPEDTPQQVKSPIGGATLAPPRHAIPLTDTPYAFSALSFMMRMLCKLHKGEPIPSSDFHSHCIPPMTVTMYVQRLVRYCACSGEALLCSFLLLLKYVFQSGHPVTIYNAHRLLITSIVLGIKLRDDVYYSNVYYGRIGGISGREMNKLELLFLEKIDWETQVHEDEYVALLDLLAELGIHKDPTSAQLEAFAATHPTEAAAYVLDDDDDDDTPGANAKLPTQGAQSTAPSSTSDATTTTTTTTANSPHAAELQRLKVLRGAYRLHQWHTLVVPWLAHLEQCVFAKAKENAEAAAAAQGEEGLRWRRYHREDELASASQRHLPPPSSSSAGVWISPLSTEQRASSKATISAPSATVWASEPPYQSTWPNRDGSNVPHRSSSGTVVIAGVVGGGGGVYTTTTGGGGTDRAHYRSFMKFANTTNSGCFGTAAPTSAPASVSQGSRCTNLSQRSNHGASVTTERSMSLSSSSQIAGHQQFADPGSAHASHYSGADLARTSNHTQHHTATMATTSATTDRPPRAASASTHFDITNRVTASSTALSATPNATSEPRQSVADTTVQLTSPLSSTTHGSGINVNAQPYYYVSSRMRKHQQQQQAAAAVASPFSVDPSAARPGSSLAATSTTSTTIQATEGSTDGATDAAQVPQLATVEGGSDAHSPPLSFTRAACINNTARLIVCPKPSTSGVASHVSQPRGIQTVTSSVNTAATIAHSNRAHAPAFPVRPITKSSLVVDGGKLCELATSTHAPRWPTHAPLHPPEHRRSTFMSQHSLGKKRSKPESYKDY
ncbi:hypothetical protein JKF63_07399 [Porcisia hertigi]|uniref:Cyclin n=1 Tax=Porcisia hertigi TaxID=2761500 RepID=A0A836LKV5_9TRYP|nr:hypothetical protein JKF63_07399 [Porcisia hertigi]